MSYELTDKWNMHSVNNLFLCLSNINRQVGRHIDGLNGVHGQYGVGQRNVAGRMLLKFCLVKELCVQKCVV